MSTRTTGLAWRLDGGTVLSAATSPCPPPPAPTGATLTQTIANGSTVKGAVNWHAVYGTATSSGRPGSVQFVVDGKVVLTEQNMPFGDTPGFSSSTSVRNGTHTFEVRAIDGSGTVIANKSVSASVANTAPSGGASSGSRGDHDLADGRVDFQRNDDPVGQRDGQRRRDSGRVPP